MNDKNLASAEAYYTAMKAKDLPLMATYLHRDVHFLGAFAKLAGKDAVIKGYEGLFAGILDINVRAKMSAADRVMLVYDLKFKEPIGNVRTAALLSFKDNLIADIEVFFDGRAFESKTT